MDDRMKSTILEISRFLLDAAISIVVKCIYLFPVFLLTNSKNPRSGKLFVLHQ